MTLDKQLREKDISSINHYYGLKITDVKPIYGGAENFNLLAKTKHRKLVITIFNDKSLKHVSHLAKLLQHLAHKNFPTNRIIEPDRAGQEVVTLAGSPVLVKQYIPGDVHTNIRDSMLSKVGGAMAVLHQISAPDYLPTEHSYGLEQFSVVEKSNIDPAYEEWLAIKSKQIKKSLRPALPLSLIHGDLFFDNVVFDGKELAALIDFEEACHYYRIFDIGMALVGLCTEEGKLNLGKSRAFLRGYLEHQAFEGEEIRSLQHFIEYAAVATSYWRFWKYNIDDPDESKATRHQEMVEVADSVHAISRDDFIAAVF